MFGKVVEIIVLTGAILTGKTSALTHAQNYYRKKYGGLDRLPENQEDMDNSDLIDHESFPNPPLYNKTKSEPIGTFDNPVIIFIDDFVTENRGQFLSSSLSFFESQILRCSSASDILIQAIEKTINNKNLGNVKYIQIICDRCFLDSIAIYNANMEQCTDMFCGFHDLSNDSDENHFQHRENEERFLNFKIFYKEKRLMISNLISSIVKSHGFTLKFTTVFVSAKKGNVKTSDSIYTKDYDVFHNMCDSRLKWSVIPYTSEEDFFHKNRRFSRDIRRDYTFFSNLLAQRAMENDVEGTTKTLLLEHDFDGDSNNFGKQLIKLLLEISSTVKNEVVNNSKYMRALRNIADKKRANQEIGTDYGVKVIPPKIQITNSLININTSVQIDLSETKEEGSPCV